MAATVSTIRSVAHLPLVLGILRQLEVATIIDRLLPPHPDNVPTGGRGVEALVLAILDGHHALYKVGARLEERGMLPFLQEGLTRESLNDYHLGQVLESLFAANLNQVFGAPSPCRLWLSMPSPLRSMARMQRVRSPTQSSVKRRPNAGHLIRSGRTFPPVEPN